MRLFVFCSLCCILLIAFFGTQESIGGGSGLYQATHKDPRVFRDAYGYPITNADGVKIIGYPNWIPLADTSGQGTDWTYAVSDSGYPGWYLTNPAEGFYDCYKDSLGAKYLVADDMHIPGRVLGDSTIYNPESFYPGVIPDWALGDTIVGEGEIKANAIQLGHIGTGAVDSAAVLSNELSDPHFASVDTLKLVEASWEAYIARLTDWDDWTDGPGLTEAHVVAGNAAGGSIDASIGGHATATISGSELRLDIDDWELDNHANANGNDIEDIGELEFDSTPDADHTASGIRATFTNGNAGSVAFGDVCYIAADDDLEFADADAAATMGGEPYMALETIAAAASGDWLKMGYARDDTWNWTPGGTVYISTTGTTGNTLTQTAPSGSGDQVQFIGEATTADIIDFDPCAIIIEVD